MIELEENKGIPKSVLLMMALVSGLTIGNLYYNQPLLELIRQDLGINEMKANFITVISQIGCALGLCFIIPMGDLYSRQRIIMINMITAAVMSLIIATSNSIWLLWGASLILGACTVIPQFFVPVAGQYSRPENKARNIGFVLSGMLTGILASRVISGFIGEWLGWRSMFFIAVGIMVICLSWILAMMPRMKKNFSGTYPQLMCSVWHIVRSHPRIRLNSIRSAFGFGSMLAIWSCLAFHISGAPFHAGSDMVGVLGACGIAGALAASSLGKYVPRYGVFRFSCVGALLQITSWIVACCMGDTYIGLIVAIILNDIGLQCQQLSNQSDCIQEIPTAANRVNTIFMTCYFIGGSLGTFSAGIGWEVDGWRGVCLVGIAFALISLSITLATKKKNVFAVKSCKSH